jgi:hypothetical protein
LGAGDRALAIERGVVLSVLDAQSGGTKFVESRE